MVKIKKQFVNKSIRNELSYGKGNALTHNTQHETANTAKSATAQMHADLQSNGNSRQASWHFQVDDKDIIQSFPVSYRCWHTGGSYNNNSIGIELCVNMVDSPERFKKAVQNAADLNKHLMKKYNIPASNIITHYSASGWKDCPHYLRSGSLGIDWSGFKKAISSSNGKVKKTKNKKPDAPKVSGNLGLVDWMNKKGMNSSFPNREKIAPQYGISNYEGTAAQNTRLLKALKKGKPKKNKKAKIKKGATVTLSKSAKNFATGESIKDSVKGKKYTVQQVKKNRVLLKEIMSWVKSSDIVGSGASSGAPNKKQKKGTVYLPASSATWKTYKLNVQPVAKNSDWSLAPKQFGGLTYKILGEPYPDVVTIKTGRGKRNIYVGEGTGAKIK